MTVSRPNMTEKLDRLIEDGRLLRAQMIGLERRMTGLDRQMKRDRSLSQTKRTERTTG
jgi:hypothetical protein